jgi:hypothetical protein
MHNYTHRTLWRKIKQRIVTDPIKQCWQWQGALDTGGYGNIRYRSKLFLTHRIAYIHFNGPIPPGLEIDHLCRNRACCQPKHLEAVTRSENILRGIGPALTAERFRLYDNRATAITLRDCRARYKNSSGYKPRRSRSPLQSSFNFED